MLNYNLAFLIINKSKYVKSIIKMNNQSPDLRNYPIEKYFSNCIGVFQGGGCKAISYIGAYKALHAKGVMFSELAGTSAGSIIAALIAAGATPDILEKLVLNTDFSALVPKSKLSLWSRGLYQLLCLCQFLKDKEQIKAFLTRLISKKFINECGVYSINEIQKWVSDKMKTITKSDKDITFKDLKLNLQIVSADVMKNSYKIWDKNNTPDELVSKAVAASCCIPIYFIPVDQRYVDGGIISNRPDFIFGKSPSYFQILSMGFEQAENPSSDIDNKDPYSRFFGFYQNLINTIIDGADTLQHNYISKTHEIKISVGEVSATDFDRFKNKREINRIIQCGETAVRKFFQSLIDPNKVEILRNPRSILETSEELFSTVAYWSYDSYDEIYVNYPDLSWAWTIFPTLLLWITRGTKIVVYVNKLSEISQQGETSIEASRYRLLRSIGCLLKEQDPESIKGFFFKKDTDYKGIVIDSDSDSDPSKALKCKLYYDKFDSMAISSQIEKLKSASELKQLSSPKIAIKEIDAKVVLQLLQNEPIYRDATLEFEKIELEKVSFLNPAIRSLKYKQIDSIFDIYKKKNIGYFKPATLVLNDSKESVIGPIVVEKRSDNYYIIEGNTRCLYAYKHGMKAIDAVVISNVRTPLPMGDDPQTYNIGDVYITEAKVTMEERYNKFDRKYYRNIEANIRPTKTYLV
jgi:hypothetical protein